MTFKYNKDKILIIIIIIWACIWAGNFYRDILNNAYETKELFGKSLKEKWEYVLGTNPSLSDDMGLFKRRRMQYFLYPNTKK